MKNFNIEIRVDSNLIPIVYKDSITVKADYLIKAYDIACDMISSTFSDDFNYTIIQIKEL